VSRVVVVGGSDAGISAALRIRQLDPYPNFSICGIPYDISGDVPDWRDLAHRTVADLEATGMRLHLETVAWRIDVDRRELQVMQIAGPEETIGYDKLVIGTGAVSVRPRIDGLSGRDALGTADGVHLLHSMGDTFAIMRTLEHESPASALIVGAGYIGLEMAEALTARGLSVTQMEQLPEVLPTVDPELGSLVHAELADQGVEVLTGTAVKNIRRGEDDGRLSVEAVTATGSAVTRTVDMILVVVGVQPDVELAAKAGAKLGAKGGIAVDRQMRTNLPDVFAAGDCVVTHHRLLGESYLPLGTTAHKQGRIAGENALGGIRRRLTPVPILSHQPFGCQRRIQTFTTSLAPGGVQIAGPSSPSAAGGGGRGAGDLIAKSSVVTPSPTRNTARHFSGVPAPPST
jgi:NADPH-dependent 2,4-dienoyl-CoA reductase/sulfur reductase-like enzyme